MRELNELEVSAVSGGFLCCFIIKKIIRNCCSRPTYPTKPNPPVNPKPPVINP